MGCNMKSVRPLFRRAFETAEQAQTSAMYDLGESTHRQLIERDQ
jgi:hypothetical protein